MGLQQSDNPHKLTFLVRRLTKENQTPKKKMLFFAFLSPCWFYTGSCPFSLVPGMKSDAGLAPICSMFVGDDHTCFHLLPSSPMWKAKGKPNSRKEQRTRSPQQVVSMCIIKKQDHGEWDKNHNLTGDFLVAYFETRHLLLMAEEEGEWEFRDGDLGFTCLWFKSVLSQALSGSP